MFINKDPNYDYAQTDDVSTEINRCNLMIAEILKNKATEKPDDLESFLSPRSKTTTRSRLPIYHQTSPKNNTDEEISSYTDYHLPWHSTEIEFDQFLHNTEESEFLRTALKPIANSIDSSKTVSDICSDSSSACSSDSENNNNTIFKIDMETIFACCLDYDAKHEGDLTVKVADRIHIVHDSGTDFVLVKHIKSLKCGYIPRVCILNVNKFLADLN
jgi:hypothetical protein